MRRHFISPHGFTLPFQELRSVVLGLFTAPILALTGVIRSNTFCFSVICSFQSSFCLKHSGLNCFYFENVSSHRSVVCDRCALTILQVTHTHTRIFKTPSASQTTITASKKRPAVAFAHCSCTNATPKTSTIPLWGSDRLSAKPMTNESSAEALLRSLGPISGTSVKQLISKKAAQKFGLCWKEAILSFHGMECQSYMNKVKTDLS